MPKPPRHLKQLEHELLALGDDAMLLEELPERDSTRRERTGRKEGGASNAPTAFQR